ncbi:hypothetical protein CFC21_055917 [Triticum aestivum]|uniref:Uncharacterized protein n=3 Tax=Triticum TaxID=4564 RepID=A0A9R0W886_TRITD|nr:acyl transferase 5-like [Triticum dicoccoides]XP_044367699.1 acyl transferase 5-like [Triticum aestivum]KAF7046929.1 hypothetical protein CFC21_055917 [Triticum aestivum]VAI00586.1 unnamed protein product [Triticum turgidum subsp. durum]
MAAPAPTVAKSPPALVPPAGPTPGGTLPLSSIDKTAAVRVMVDFIQVFQSPSSDSSSVDEQVAAMRQGFARALVPYYPVAGRIAEPTPGEPVVDCTGEGVWFVEAAASCSLADVNGLEDRPLAIPKADLIPRPPADHKLEDQILLAQITKFTCGGYAVGICFSHLVFDGQGAAQFLTAVGEMARGLPEPSVKPIWSRDAIPNPPKPPLGPPPSFTAFNFVKSTVEISLDSIKRVKDQVAAETAQRCSTFDVVTAMIFKCRAAAIGSAPDAEVRLGFAAGTRHLLGSSLPSPEGYYGNCVYPGGLARASKDVEEASLVEIVTAIREAKDALSARFLDWLGGGAKDSHYNVSLDYGTLVVTDWSHVGFNDVDYGFGEPTYVFTLNDDVNIVPSVVYLKPPKPKQGIRLVLQCVEEPHATVFTDELHKLA